MLFLIEGVDRTGKSTLAGRLAERCDRPEIMHFSAPKHTAIVEYLEPIRDYFPGCGRDLILDRHYLGELVWPTIFGRPSRMSALDRDCIEAYLSVRGATCVWAVRRSDELEAACADEPCVGRAAESQRMFGVEVRASILEWFRYTHGSDIDGIVSKARCLESAARLDFTTRRVDA